MTPGCGEQIDHKLLIISLIKYILDDINPKPQTSNLNRFMYSIPVGFHFMADFGLGEGEDDHRFQEVVGLSSEVTLEEFKEGGVNDFVHRMPTGVKYGNLVLKRGMFNDSQVTEWCRKAIETFEFEPTTVKVTLLNEEHETLASWDFLQAYPIKWSISDFKAMDNSLVVESLELAYRSFRKN